MVSRKIIWVVFFVTLLFILIYGNLRFEREIKIRYYYVNLVIADFNDVKSDENSLTVYSQPGRVISGSIIIQDAEAKKVDIVKEGEVANWVELSENKFEIRANESYNLPITLKIPRNYEIGNYSMNLKIELR